MLQLQDFLYFINELFLFFAHTYTAFTQQPYARSEKNSFSLCWPFRGLKAFLETVKFWCWKFDAVLYWDRQQWEFLLQRYHILVTKKKKLHIKAITNCPYYFIHTISHTLNIKKKDSVFPVHSHVLFTFFFCSFVWLCCDEYFIVRSK